MSSSEKKSTISRRDLLKVLGATGAGLIGSLMLPGKWSKPVTRMGVLPAHAQASQVQYSIVDSAEVEDFQQEIPTLTPTVYISPADSGIAMSCSYELGYPDPNLAAVTAYDPPINLPLVNTAGGVATFEPIELLFEVYPDDIRITYEFDNQDVCDTNCSRVVTYFLLD